MSFETVSVIIPFYNRARCVADAVASIVAQTRPAHEIIVVNDGSDREEAAALDRIAANAGAPVRVIHLPHNRGACVARNIGIARATGSYIAMLDCDDLWVPNKLEKQMRFFAEHPEFRAVHCPVKSISPDGHERSAPKSDIRFDDLVLFPCPAFPSAVVMQRDALFECGLFNPTKRACQDLDLFLRFTSQYPIGCIDEPLVIRRVQPDSLSRNLATFWHEADRVYRDYRYVFSDQKAAAKTLIDLSADFLLDAVYARDRDLFWKVFRRATHNDVTVPRLLGRAAKGLVRNWLDRRRPA
jgi:glycosyltransferase involved in cell wall biosynthesis